MRELQHSLQGVRAKEGTGVMKKILCTVVCFQFLAGCGPQIKSDALIALLNDDSTVDSFVRDMPEYLYCFDRDEQELREDLDDTFAMCARMVRVAMPDMVGQSSATNYGRKIGDCVTLMHYRSNEEFYSSGSLPSWKVEKCAELRDQALTYSKLTETGKYR